ncbi:MAG: NYN domain-containing protein [Cyanobacteria bacterium P01_H01_bin.119]
MSRSSPPQALLLVDGYNIIGAWPALLQAQAAGLEQARSELVELLVNYSAYRGFETHIIFDAYAQAGPSNQEVVTQHLRIYYTHFGQTADTYIEKVCAQFREDARKFTQRLIVATSDRAQQLTVKGYGAECLSAQQLAADVHVVSQGVQRQQRTRKKSTRRLLMNNLDPKTRDQLARLRQGQKPV